MLSPVALHAAFAALPLVEYRRTLYRTIRPGFLSPTPLSGVGATIRGARFTPKGGFNTIYLAEDPMTAYVEFQHESLTLMRDMDDEFGVRLAVLATLTPYAFFVHSGILDVTRREVRVALKTDLNELSAPWRLIAGPGLPLPTTQILGQEAYNSGLFLGIRYFSARNPDGICFAIFEDRLRATTGSDFLDLDDSRNGGPKQRIP
jgi:RES domain-containing protein